jgi:hypothetical protein
LARPFKILRPGAIPDERLVIIITGVMKYVPKNVANEVSISSVDQDWDLGEDIRYQAMIWLHPVTGEQEISVDIKVTAIVTAHFNAKLRHNSLLVQILADPAKSRVAKVAAILTFPANVIYIIACLLIRANHGVIAVDASGYARPDALAIVAVLD